MRGCVLTAVLLLVLCAAQSSAAAESELLLNAGFDDANLTGWRTAGDLCVAPAFCAGEPSGRYWIAMSTNDAEGDSQTMCGTSSLGGLSSLLRSPDLPLPFKPSRIRVDFKIKFLTNENTSTDLGTDLLTVRLLTMAGPLVLAAFDDSGASPGSKNLSISGDAAFKASDCSSNWRYETGLLQVSYYRTFRDPVRSKMAEGPVALEFALTNEFDRDFDSAVVIDDVQLRVYP
jgi:hypothetical protein